MSILTQPEASPLREDGSGALRAGASNVLFELVVRAFQDGATPEAIVQRYESLSLAETYAVIAHYLRHREEVAVYLDEREQAAAAIKQQIDAAQEGPELNAVQGRLHAHNPLAAPFRLAGESP